MLDELPLDRRPGGRSSQGRTRSRILDRDDDRLLVVVGPCSVHDPEAALDYARGSAPGAELQDDLCIVMRVYFEKPRTTIGWKGLINDPHLDGQRRRQQRAAHGARLLLEVLDLGLPIGCEFLDPITPQYISDAVAWGAIGARTTESQIHRQLASGLSMPVGFKNGTDGDVQVAVDAVRAAAAQHAFSGVDVERHAGDRAHARQPRLPRDPARRQGRAELRRRAVGGARLLRAPACRSALMIDASHDNSGKDHTRQPAVAARDRRPGAAGNAAIVGVMLESFLVDGRQDLEPRRAARLRPVDHRRLHGLGDDGAGPRPAGAAAARRATPA